MTASNTIRGTKLLIKIGDGGSPEVFAHPCSFAGQRSMQLQAQTNDVTVPDCDLPDQLAWVEREKVSVSATISGEGVLNAEDQDIFFDFVTDEDPRNVKTYTDVAGSAGGRIYAGSYHCTQFEISGTRGEKITANIQMQSTGVITKTNNAG